MDNDKRLQVAAAGVVAAAAVAGYASVAVLKFASPVELHYAGACAACGLMGTWVSLTFDWRKLAVVWWFIVLTAGVFWASAVISRAVEASTANDKRCAAIQRIMLAPNPIRSDGPDLFQALGCRPQNLPFTEWPTKVERAANG